MTPELALKEVFQALLQESLPSKASAACGGFELSPCISSHPIESSKSWEDLCNPRHPLLHSPIWALLLRVFYICAFILFLLICSALVLVWSKAMMSLLGIRCGDMLLVCEKAGLSVRMWAVTLLLWWIPPPFARSPVLLVSVVSSLLKYNGRRKAREISSVWDSLISLF